MLETLFGEPQYGFRFIFAAIVGLTLIALIAWLVRRFGARPSGITSSRGRQRRLAVTGAVSVDARRRLILIRRDNVEHLMMIGGLADVVVEANIVGAGMPARDTHPAPAIASTLPHPVPLDEGSAGRLLQLEPAPAPQFEPPAQTVPQVQAAPITPTPAPTEEYAERVTAAPSRQPQPAPQGNPALTQHAGAGLEDDLARTVQPRPELATSETRPARREPRMALAWAEGPPHPSLTARPPGEADNLPEDQEVAEMTRRLEAVLRRPAKPD